LNQKASFCDIKSVIRAKTLINLK